MNTKKLIAGMLSIVLSIGCAACGGTAASSDRFVLAGPGQSAPSALPQETMAAPTEREESPAAPQDLPSPQAIPAALTGEWQVYDQNTETDYGALSISGDGSCSYTRAADGLTAYGRFATGSELNGVPDAPNCFSIRLDDVPDAFFPVGAAHGDVSETAGHYYVSSFDGEDALYLREVGNGESLMAVFLLNPHPEQGYENIPMEWLLHRKNDSGRAAAGRENDEFDAWVWKQSGAENGLWLQPMTADPREAYTEYTNRHYQAAYFTAEEPEAAWYPVDHTSVETWRLLSGSRFDYPRSYPLLMVHVRTDAQGIITAMEEIDRTEYGLYELGELPQEYSFDGLEFTYNGQRFDLRDYGAANAVLDCTEVGDCLVLEGHINPNISEYLLFSKGSGDFEYEIYATNLIWQGEDLSTAVYLQQNAVYNFAGDMIGYIQEGEAYDLSFGAAGKTVVAACRETSGGSERSFTEEFDLPETGDEAMYAYGNYLLRPCASTWKAFLDQVSPGALALVMVNPPRYILSRARFAEGAADDTVTDRVVLAALKDGTSVRLDEGGLDDSWKWQTSRAGAEYTLSQGSCVCFAATVPEGLPFQALQAAADNQFAVWPVFTLSGEVPRHSLLLKEDAAPAAQAAPQDPDGMELYRPVLEETAALLRSGYDPDRDYQYLSSGIMEYAMYAERGEALAGLGYALLDLSGDGIPELLLCTIPGANGQSEDSAVFSGYTFRNGQPACFLEGWARSSYQWMGDNRFYHFGSNGAMSSGFGVFSLSRDGTQLLCEDFYFTDASANGQGIELYHNTSGAWDQSVSELLDMPEDAFWQRMEEYEASCVPLPWTPFSEYV